VVEIENLCIAQQVVLTVSHVTSVLFVMLKCFIISLFTTVSWCWRHSFACGCTCLSVMIVLHYHIYVASSDA